ncbi:hypothetical protein NE688_14460 [Eubacterium callanderi]|nr:hypothetical protein [Eubacterium callanderi]MCG4590328.1 hypothetical protein [Eubacterium callanderi]MCQ4821937.1 hypothetical protein [Eubacterium callanderi]MCQ4826034.1 hypothetical protein [Eubacterium callanderi]
MKKATLISLALTAVFLVTGILLGGFSRTALTIAAFIAAVCALISALKNKKE